jgi:hypothetical protein
MQGIFILPADVCSSVHIYLLPEKINNIPALCDPVYLLSGKSEVET